MGKKPRPPTGPTHRERKTTPKTQSVPPPTDNELMVQAQSDGPAGRAAFGELVRRRGTALVRYLGNLLPDDLAEDAAQEVFLTVWHHRMRFDPRRGGVAAWLFTIARHRAFNLQRRIRYPERERVLETAPTADADPERKLAVKEVYAALDDALEALPFDQRSVFVLAEIQGFTMDEIAAVEGLPVGTVKSRLARTRRKMKRRLKQIGDLLDE